jgi:glycosyltransferase involved in cell wall biosynthesis
MLLGLPVIATAVGGVIDIVRDDETGLLTDGPDDTLGFVNAIRGLLESRDKRRRLIEGAYEFAVRQHSWEAFARDVDDTIISSAGQSQ